MSSITIPIPDERLAELKEKAARLKVSPEDLVWASIQELLARPDESFESTAVHILKKNQELYNRLA